VNNRHKESRVQQNFAAPSQLENMRFKLVYE
jgi:hypothetical protein